MLNLTYRELYGSESSGSYGTYGIKILVAGSQIPADLSACEIRTAASQAAHLVEAEIRALGVQNDPKAQKHAASERADLLALFPSPIFVEEIPNGYDSSWYSRHLPWFVVTTEVGRIKIGWRKRVINIDWEGTRGTKKATELFPTSKSTKGDYYIHAWSYEDAKEIVDAVLNSAKPTRDEAWKKSAANEGDIAIFTKGAT